MRRNSLNKHFEKIANSPVYQEVPEDLLEELKALRKKYSCSQTSRPQTSSLLKNSVLRDSKSPEHLTERVAKNQTVFQRLSRGAQTSRNLTSNIITKFEKVTSDRKLTQIETAHKQKEVETCSQFLESFKELQSLKFDLDLNFKLARTEETLNTEEDSKLGIYYSLEESLKELLNETTSQLLNKQKGVFAERLKNYTLAARELIRSLKSKGNEDQAVLIEMLWRGTAKLFDSACAVHTHTLNSTVEIVHNKLKRIVGSSKKDIENALKVHKKKENQYQKHNEKLKAKIKSLKTEKTELEEIIKEKDKVITEFMQFDNKEKTMLGMKKLLRGLNGLISETEKEFSKQTSALSSLSNIMTVREELDKPPLVSEVSAQTDLRLFPQLLPLKSLSRPLFTNHPYELLLSNALPSPVPDERIQELYSVLLKDSSNLDFPHLVVIYLKEEFPTSVDSTLLYICLRLKELTSSDWAYVFLKLLQLERPLPKSSEIFLKTLHFKLKEHCGLEQFILQVKKLFSAQRSVGERILESVSIKCNLIRSIDKNKPFSSLKALLCRFSLALEKLKRSPVSFIQKLSSSKNTST